MRLQLLRFGIEVEFTSERVQTIEILDRTLFARVVASLLSEEGENAVEAYELWSDAGKRLTPKKRLLVLNDLPRIPYDNKTLLGKLYTVIASGLEVEGELEKLDSTGRELLLSVADSTNSLWGRYDFGIDWNAATLLKAFSFAPDCSSANSLLENCIAFFGFCIDIKLEMPLVLVNAKSFFAPEELDALIEQAVFYGVKVMLLESWHDSISHLNEEKTILDQQFIQV
jgi:CRISPR type II-A-associated protein Csn2